MTTFTALSNSVLQLDEPVTEAVVRSGMRDNMQATVEGDASVPTNSQIQPRSINSPYFFAKRTTDYTVNSPGGSVWKVAFDTEVYDPDGLYDNTANSGNGYRFKPDKPGLYLVNVYCQIQTPGGGSATPTPIVSANLYKNGSLFAQVTQGTTANTNGAFSGANLVCLVQMNGSTDYLEGWVGDSVSSSFAPSNPVRGHFSAVGLCQS